MTKTKAAAIILGFILLTLVAMWLFYPPFQLWALMEWGNFNAWLAGLNLNSTFSVVMANWQILTAGIGAVSAIGIPIYKWAQNRQANMQAAQDLAEQKTISLANQVQNNQTVTQLKNQIQAQEAQITTLKNNTDSTELQNENITLQKELTTLQADYKNVLGMNSVLAQQIKTDAYNQGIAAQKTAAATR